MYILYDTETTISTCKLQIFRPFWHLPIVDSRGGWAWGFGPRDGHSPNTSFGDSAPFSYSFKSMPPH